MTHLRKDGSHVFPLTPRVPSSPWFWLLVSALIGCSVGAAILENGFLVVPGLLGLGFMIWSFARPAVVLPILVLSYFIILEPSEGVTIYEVIFGIYFFGYLGFWFIDQWYFQHKKIVRTTADMFLMIFILLCFVSVIVALPSGASPLKWFREFLTVAALLLYFPARDAFKNDKSLKISVLAILLLSMMIAVKNLINYRANVLAATYFFEVLESRKAASAHFFFATTIVSLSYLIHRRWSGRKIVLLVVLVISVAALIFTFARGFWIGTIAGIGVLFLLTDRLGKIRLFSGAMCLLIGLAVAMVFVNGNFLNAIQQTVVSRFESSGNALEDISFLNRLVESKAVLARLSDSPVIGNGFGSTFNYYSLLDHVTIESWYIHNAYLFLMFKVGLIGTMLFLGYYGTTLFRGIQNSRNSSHDKFLPLIRGTTALLCAMLLTAITSSLFIEKQSLLIIALGTALIAARNEVTTSAWLSDDTSHDYFSTASRPT